MIRNMEWPQEGRVQLDPQRVYVWEVDLDVEAERQRDLLKLLSADEVARARRFHFSRDRRRYTVARGMLRTLLAHCLETEPQAIAFGYSSRGKPHLRDAQEGRTLYFNVSHAGETALIALARGRAVGVDLEQWRPGLATGEIVRRFFSAQEVDKWLGLPAGERDAHFLRCWTRKEAFLKATGWGLSFPMEQVDVSKVLANAPSPIHTVGASNNAPAWFGQDLSTKPNFAAAIVARGDDWELRMV